MVVGSGLDTLRLLVGGGGVGRKSEVRNQAGNEMRERARARREKGEKGESESLLSLSSFISQVD